MLHYKPHQCLHRYRRRIYSCLHVFIHTSMWTLSPGYMYYCKIINFRMPFIYYYFFFKHQNISNKVVTTYRILIIWSPVLKCSGWQNCKFKWQRYNLAFQNFTDAKINVFYRISLNKWRNEQNDESRMWLVKFNPVLDFHSVWTHDYNYVH